MKHSTLSLDFAKLGIDYYFAISQSRHIRFYGPGEPTQEIDLISSILEYAQSKENIGVITAEIQTNGAFGDECCIWLAENIDYIWISFDGPPDIQNQSRPFMGGAETSSIIEKNIQRMFSYRKTRNGVVGARVTMSNNNIYRQKEMIDYFLSIGIAYVWTDAMFPSVEDCPFCDSEMRIKQFDFDMDGYVEEFVGAYKYAQDKGVFYGSFLMCNFDGITNKFCRACIPSLHLTSDGFISACDLAILGDSLANHMSPFIFGKYNEEEKKIELFEDKISLLQARTTDSMPQCVKCDVAEHCAGYCLGEVVNETGSLYGQKKETCNAIKKLANEIGFTNKQYTFFHP